MADRVAASTSEDDAACVLCASEEMFAASGRLACRVCGWLVGDSPDPDLPPPLVEVVYYLRWKTRIKIGTSSRPKQRLAAIRHEELLAFELGGRPLEQQRHRQFADLREGGEWFHADETLLDHVRQVAGVEAPWDRYARWMADALRQRVS